jgi:hypothetical protein
MLSNKPSLGSFNRLGFGISLVAIALFMCVTVFGQSYYISGVVYNELTETPGGGTQAQAYVSNAQICAWQQGVQVQCVNSDTIASYQLGPFSYGGPTELRVSKAAQQDINGAITQADVDLLYNVVYNSYTLTDAQKLAADVSCNNSITSYDLGLLSNFIGAHNAYGCTGTWLFWPDGELPPWPGHASESQYFDSITDNPEVDFDGVLKGDINGSWRH